MNERIRELWEQCKTYDWNLNRPTYTYDHEKFAGLIVMECIECADNVGKANLDSGYPNSTAHHVKQKIREHFGVE